MLGRSRISNRKTPLVVLLCLAYQAISITAKAQTLDFSFNPAVRAGHRGETTTYRATLTNNTGSSISFNSSSFTLGGAGVGEFDLDDLKLFSNFPLTFSPGQSVTAEIFDLRVFSLADGIYTGTYNLQNDGNVVGSQNFQLNVTPAPPALLVMLIGGLGTAAAVRRRSKDQ